MKQKVIGLWMYRNDGGNVIQEKLKEFLEEKNCRVVNDFDMRECYCFNGRVYTKEGFDLSSVDLFYHMNADEQSPHQYDIQKALELSGVKVINDWNSFYTAKNKFMTNVLLKKNGINVPPSVFVSSKEVRMLAPRIFKEWKKVCVKPVIRHGGKGIIAFKNEEQFIDFVEATENFTNSYYIEKFINFEKHDYRIEILENKVISGYCRNRTHSYKTNICSGGYYISEKPSKDFEEIALKAAKVLNIQTTIIDMVQSSKDNQIYLLEVNPSMGIFVDSFISSLYDKKNPDLKLYPNVVNFDPHNFFKSVDQKKLEFLGNYLISMIK